MSALLDELRSIGLPMVSRYPAATFTREDDVTVTRQLHVSWTTDKEKAEAAAQAGAIVQAYESPLDPAYNGWDVSIHEVIEQEESP